MPQPLTWDDFSLAFDTAGLFWDSEAVNPPSHHMPDDNRISAELASATVTVINNAIATIRTSLPFLLSLSNEERRTLPKLGDSRLALDEDAYTLMGDQPDLVPVFVEMAELTKDRVLRARLDDIRLKLATLSDDVASTELVLGSEMLTAYLAFYSNAQQASKRGVPGAQAVVDVLKKYFARPGRPATPPAPTPPNP